MSFRETDDEKSCGIFTKHKPEEVHCRSSRECLMGLPSIELASFSVENQRGLPFIVDVLLGVWCTDHCQRTFDQYLLS